MARNRLATAIRAHWPLRYALVLVIVAAVTVLRVPLAPLLGNSVPFILYFPAVVIAGWLGGFGPGLAATLLSGYCARTWFFEPVGKFSIPDFPSAFRLGLFVLSGTLISFLCGRLHQRSRELEAEKALLEEKVKERTSHLEHALNDMEAFAYTVSHDLRSPVRAIQGFSEVMLEEHSRMLDAQAKLNLERIRNSAGRLNRLIDDLLAFAKVSSTAASTQPIALRDAMNNVLADSPHLRSPSAKVLDQGCVHTVLAHDTLLRQALQNLLENAAKFVEPGVTPEIRLWSEPRGEFVRLWVADNGIGIPTEGQKVIFQRFERLEATRYSGTGLGLAIVDRAVSKMNGRVGLESEPGRGSRFWIELPQA
jgi:signal transduction histidine kinase